MGEQQTPADIRRITSGQDWSGFLTLANLDAVADRIRSMIGGGRPYTWIACNEGLGNYRPEVRTGQAARTIDVCRIDRAGGPHGDIQVHDSYGLWWICTDAQDQAAAHGREPSFELAYLDITRTYVRIATKAPAGYRLWWVVAVEGGAS
ncbi:hypothetical protein ACFHW2_12210 [Actinomadura sp. LOL_016]|uniref:hypothetical protein n=1 Tax=unclassified Actinomadura TaxID=2626254 RepID=UPI003A7F90F7